MEEASEIPKKESELEPSADLEDTREFTLEEVRALGLYAEWLMHRQLDP